MMSTRADSAGFCDGLKFRHRTCRRGSSFAVVAGLVITTLIAKATVADPTDDTAEPIQTIAAENAKRIVDRAVRVYRSLRTYRDEFSIQFETRTKDGGDAYVPLPMSDQNGSFVFERPNRIALDTGQMSLFCDGKMLWVSMRMLDQYKQMPAPAALDMDAILFELPGGFAPPTHPVATIVLRPDRNLSDLFPMLGKIRHAKREPLNGRPGATVVASVEFAMLPSDQPLIVELWFDDETGALHELRVDLTPAFKAMNEMASEGESEDTFNPFQKIAHAEMTVSFRDVVLNGDIPENLRIFG